MQFQWGEESNKGGVVEHLNLFVYKLLSVTYFWQDYYQFGGNSSEVSRQLGVTSLEWETISGQTTNLENWILKNLDKEFKKILYGKTLWSQSVRQGEYKPQPMSQATIHL